MCACVGGKGSYLYNIRYRHFRKRRISSRTTRFVCFFFFEPYFLSPSRYRVPLLFFHWYAHVQFSAHDVVFRGAGTVSVDDVRPKIDWSRPQGRRYVCTYAVYLLRTACSSDLALLVTEFQGARRRSTHTTLNRKRRIFSRRRVFFGLPEATDSTSCHRTPER